MTTVYFVRHAESDHTKGNETTRPLTEKGEKDCRLVTEFLKDKNIDVLVSSPFKRAVDTLSDFSEASGLSIETMEDFRERENEWFPDESDFWCFAQKQWADFTYTLSGGECLQEVQDRNVAALKGLLLRYPGKNIVIGTHGTALSTIIHYYNSAYGFSEFEKMVHHMPWIVKMTFEGTACAELQTIDVFSSLVNDAVGEWKTLIAPLNQCKAYYFSVIFARYQNKWLYCRHKKRNTYETAGGHIEKGETPIEAARRELFEETGAISYDIVPAFDYSTQSSVAFSHGQVFFANIHELGALPESEMAEVKLFDSIPDTTTYPGIMPVLYKRLQGWLNVQSSKDELWDVYDENRTRKGYTHRRGDPLPANDFHLVVFAWIINRKGEALITKRSPNKGYPNMWECTGGSAVAGDDSLTAVVREVKEETGLSVLPEEGTCIFSLQRDDCFADVWLFRQDFPIEEVVLQEGETCDAKWVSLPELREIISKGEFVTGFAGLNEKLCEMMQELMP